MDNSRGQIGDYLAKVPFAVGHELDDDHVVVSAIRADQRPIAHLVLDWDDHVPAQQVAEQVTRALTHADPPARLTVVGYGPDGARRARDLADHLRRTTPTSVMPVHVQGGIWRDLDGTWPGEHPLPDLTAELIMAGFPIPAVSRSDLEASLTPLPASTFTPLDDATADHLAALTPRQRAELAQETLERVAETRLDEPEQMRILAHLATTDLVTRDVILAHTLDRTIRDDRVEAVVRTFRAAPPQQRPGLAVLASAATFFACWPPAKTRALLQHADPLARLSDLVDRALAANVDPRMAHDTVRDGAVEGLRQSEQGRHAARDRTQAPATRTDRAAGTERPRMEPPPPTRSRPDVAGPNL